MMIAAAYACVGRDYGQHYALFAHECVFLCL